MASPSYTCLSANIHHFFFLLTEGHTQTYFIYSHLISGSTFMCIKMWFWSFCATFVLISDISFNPNRLYFPSASDYVFLSCLFLIRIFLNLKFHTRFKTFSGLSHSWDRSVLPKIIETVCCKTRCKEKEIYVWPK